MAVNGRAPSEQKSRFPNERLVAGRLYILSPEPSQGEGHAQWAALQQGEGLRSLHAAAASGPSPMQATQGSRPLLQGEPWTKEPEFTTVLRDVVVAVRKSIGVRAPNSAEEGAAGPVPSLAQGHAVTGPRPSVLASPAPRPCHAWLGLQNFHLAHEPAQPPASKNHPPLPRLACEVRKATPPASGLPQRPVCT